MKRPVVVIPTNRPDKFNEWLHNWKNVLQGCHLIVVYDGDTIAIDTTIMPEGFSYQVFTWNDIDNDLGKDSWIIPRRSDCVRSYGFLKALECNPLFIITLDDDTKPIGNTIEEHYTVLFGNKKQLRHNANYYNTMSTMLPRGYLHDLKSTVFDEVMLSHGVWYGTPDLDAFTQITDYKNSTNLDFNRGIIPKNAYFSMCGMNIAFKPEVTKYLYFGLQGKNYPIDRCGDIWAGYYFSQNNEDYYAVTGFAPVIHDRASNPWTNLIKETNSVEMGELFIKYLCNKESIDEKLPYYEYFNKLVEAYNIWERLCNERLERS
ncbi:MAG TPA: hypothetical protein V6C58_19615 [Allocoleopsis sp.]